MSILIKGMTMPEEGQVFVVFVDSSKHYVLYNDMRYPLIELPDHGDLIDMEKLRKVFTRLADIPWNANTMTTWSKAYGCVEELLDEAPVVIPAERSGG